MIPTMCGAQPLGSALAGLSWLAWWLAVGGFGIVVRGIVGGVAVFSAPAPASFLAWLFLLGGFIGTQTESEDNDSNASLTCMWIGAVGLLVAVAYVKVYQYFKNNKILEQESDNYRRILDDAIDERIIARYGNLDPFAGDPSAAGGFFGQEPPQRGDFQGAPRTPSAEATESTPLKKDFGQSNV